MRYGTQRNTRRNPTPLPRASRLVDWIGQFSAEDQDLAARVLDAIDYYGVPRITGAYRSILDGLPGWNAREDERRGEWRFCEYSASAGKSAAAMLYRFRHANGLSSRRYNELFIYRSEIPGVGLGGDDSLVLIDDFIGTGTTAEDAWNDFFQELVAGMGTVYLVTAAASPDAIQRMADQTDLTVATMHVLGPSDCIFAPECDYFNEDDRVRLQRYCRKVSRGYPHGFGGLGLLVVFQHNCPNNSIPVLHARGSCWQPLFPRHE